MSFTISLKERNPFIKGRSRKKIKMVTMINKRRVIYERFINSKVRKKAIVVLYSRKGGQAKH